MQIFAASEKRASLAHGFMSLEPDSALSTGRVGSVYLAKPGPPTVPPVATARTAGPHLT